MNAAGSSLDEINSSGSSYRNDGTTLILKVEYSNTRSWSGLSKDITYLYTPFLLSDTSFKLYESIWEGTGGDYRANRTLLNKHGVKIDLVQGGNLAKFSFSQLLVSLTTSLTLLAVATVITDIVALYFLPDKDRYENAKYELTEDFSDLRDAEEEAAKNKGKTVGPPSSSSMASRGTGSNNDGYRLIDSEDHGKLYGEKGKNKV